MLRPDDPQLADAAADQRAVYLHTPFCARICPYCDFAVVEGRDDLTDRYVEAVIQEVGRLEPWGPVDSLYLGGGTPSRLGGDHLAALVEAVGTTFGLAPDAEISMEANPEDVDADRAAAFSAAGFNRISFGAQSFDGGVLEYLGRRHHADQITSAVDAARAAGFRTINVDLIFGSPGESFTAWTETVAATLALDIDHLSAYALTVERGTPLSRSVAAGASAPDPDAQADAYDHLAASASAAGLVQYEVSNWARPGHTCRYNLVTWAHGDYDAAGLGAHRHRGGVRSWNVRNLDTYVERVEAGESPRLGEESLGSTERERERLMVGVRRTAGVALGDAGRMWAGTAEAQRFLEHEVIAVDRDRLRVVRPLFTDAVARSLLTDSTS